MSDLVLLGSLLAGVVVLTPIADRLRVPQPILLLLFGLGLAFVHGLPDLQSIDPDLVLPVVLPPLLFAATQRATVGQFREAAGPVLLLAVGLTLATALVAAVAAHVAGLPWSAAAVLGAIVSPPDPVAATAVARRLKLPERLVTILEGEGMFNDATALVLYRVTVVVAVTGDFKLVTAAGDLLLALVVGVAGGLLLGWMTRLALGLLHDAGPETTVTIAAPFVAYLGAEHLRGSGVLAVLVLGLYLRSYGHPALTARGWLLGRSVWEYADFLITGIVFVLVGYELTVVIGGMENRGAAILPAVLVVGAVVVLRPIWLFPAGLLARALQRRRDLPVPLGWRETAVASWAGMRGVVTVATALALPAVGEDGKPLAWRETVVFVALVCVLVTLVGQGLTLTLLVQRLGVGSETDEADEIRQLKLDALRAALDDLRANDDDDPTLRAAVMQYEGRVRGQEVLARTLHRGSGVEEQESRAMAERLTAALLHASDVEREVVLQARSRGIVSPATADKVLDDIEARAAQLES